MGPISNSREKPGNYKRVRKERKQKQLSYEYQPPYTRELQRLYLELRKKRLRPFKRLWTCATIERGFTYSCIRRSTSWSNDI